MSKFFYFTIVLVFIAACSSSSPKVETNIKIVETNAVSNKAVVSTVNQPNTNTVPSPNGNIIIQNFAVSKDNIGNAKGKKGAGAGDALPIPNATRAAVAAPDNSEIVNTMDAKGQPLETRTFKNHPILVKIQRTDLNNRDIKVYLKNGKVVILPENQAGVFLTAPAGDILKAVGLN